MKKLYIAIYTIVSLFLSFNIHAYILIDGIKTASIRREKLQNKIATTDFNRAPHLAIVHVEDEDQSKSVYISHKIRACERIGFTATHLRCEHSIAQRALKAYIQQLNNDVTIDGIIVQLPLPHHLDQWDIIDSIAPQKDVDGLTRFNIGALKRSSLKHITPATAKGILALLKEYEIITRSKECVIIGGSELVGHPLQVLLSREDNHLSRAGATVTLCHKDTPDLQYHTSHADILIVAVGHPGLITGDMVKDGAIVIDAGITRVGNKLMGDVVFDEVAPKCTAITSVPGGVGPMTVISLLENLYKVATSHFKT